MSAACSLHQPPGPQLARTTHLSKTRTFRPQPQRPRETSHTMSGNLTVNGESQFDSNVNIDAKLTVDNLCVENDLDLLGNLDVAQKLTTQGRAS